MYETEVNDSLESIDAIPPEILERFAEFRHRVFARTTLPWGEHCTECVWPTCYTTCDLYSARPDGNCRQFVDGMVRIDHKGGLSPYLLKLRFKQWAKLWTIGNLHLHSLSKAETREFVNITVGAVGRNIPLPVKTRHKVLQKINYLRRRAADQVEAPGELPDYFLLECYNPNAKRIELSFTVRGAKSDAPPFQTMISLSAGYTRAIVPLGEMTRFVDIRQPFTVEMVPNDCDDTVLYFGLMDFVKERTDATVKTGSPQSGTGKIKCIVWDLDNTLWDGVLVEDGLDKIRIREGVLNLIRQTDEQGILHSIASKNNEDDAMAALRTLGMEDYFLYPQIKWQPKSQSIADIANLLNIGVETLAFVDDQQFEREEVKTAVPQVTVIDAADYASIRERPELRVPVTTESKNRRSMYREQERRRTALSEYAGDYLGFLRDCRMEMTLKPLDETNIQRVYELAQRTNQLNFSGNRYEQAQLVRMTGLPDIETYVINCNDRFGNYGIVGFAVVDLKVPQLLDLMFSCRVQGKRVDHAVLSFLLERFEGGEDQAFYATYRQTAKNAAAGKVFEEVGFERTTDGEEGRFVFKFRQGRSIPNDQIVKINSLIARESPVR